MSVTQNGSSTVQILLRTVQVSVRVSAGSPIVLSEDPLDISQVLRATDGMVRTVGQADTYLRLVEHKLSEPWLRWLVAGLTTRRTCFKPWQVYAVLQQKEWRCDSLFSECFCCALSVKFHQ